MFKQIKKTNLNLFVAGSLLRGLRFVLFLVALTGVFLYTRVGTPARVEAATSDNLNFQARLLTGAGSIVPDGTYNVEFKIYRSLASGASAQGVCVGGGTDDCLWRESYTGANKVNVRAGYLSVQLGSQTSFPAMSWDQNLYLTMNIGGTGAPSYDGEMTPRLKLTGVPYAFAAGQLAKFNGTQTGTLSFNTVANSPDIKLPDITGTNNVLLQAGTTLFTQGSVPFTDSTGRLTQSNANFYFDSTNNTLGVGTTRTGAIDGTGNSRLVVKGSGATSSTSSLNITNSSNTSLLLVRDDGNVGIGTITLGTNNRLIVNAYSTVDNLATAQINTNAATNKGLVVQGFASQTADLLQAQNSAGTSVFQVGHGTKPITVAGAGTTGGTILTVTGNAGGDTSGTGTTAGVGSAISLTAGAGGTSSGGTNVIGGAGGAFTFTGGAGGASTGTAINSNGGALTLQGGAAGTGGSGTAGSYGNIILQNSGGNVGIGTANPSFPLSLGNSLGNKLGLYDAGSGAGYGFGIQANLLQVFSNAVGDDISFGYGNSGAFTRNVTFKGSGNVGIGTTAPASRLDVAGSARLTASGTSVITGSIDPTASTSVTGVGTFFGSQLVVGDRITINGETRTVTVITSATNLTVDTAFTDTANDTTIDRLPAALTVQDSASALKLVVNDQGNVGIGTAAPVAKLHVTATTGYSSFTDYSGATTLIGSGIFDSSVTDAQLTTSIFKGVQIQALANFAANASKTVIGASILAATPSSAVDFSGLTLRGANLQASHLGTGTLANAYGVLATANNNSTGTITNGVALRGKINNLSTGTFGSAYGLYIDNIINNGTLTNTYGAYVGDITTGTQTNTPYSFYASDPNAYNYFAGNVGIGTSTGLTEKLTVAGNISQVITNNTTGINLTATGTTITTNSNNGGVGGVGVGRGELVLEQTGDYYGTTRLRLQSRTGSNGALIEAAGGGAPDLVDLGFKPPIGPQAVLRQEHRSGSLLNAANTNGELQYIDDSTGTPTNVLAVGKNATLLNSGVLGVGTVDTSVLLNVAKSTAGNGVSTKISNLAAAGAGQYANLIIEADNNTANRLYLNQLSASWVSSGVNIASGTTLQATGSGGLSLAADNASGIIRFYSGGTTERARFDTTGNFGLGTSGAPSQLLSIGGTTGNLTVNSSGNLITAGTVQYANGTSDSATYVCKNAAGQLAACNTTGSGAAFLQSGNAFGATAVLGTTDANGLQIITGASGPNGRAYFDTSNNLFLGNAGTTGTAAAPNAFVVQGTGSSTSGTAGGALTVNGGTGNGAAAGGALNLNGGTGGATGNGGAVTVQGGTGGATSGIGGAAKLQGGTAIGAFAGGLATVQGGTAAATAGSIGGGVAITAAGGSTTGTGAAGGSITVTAGNAGGSGINNGGTITLQAGSATSTGTNGGVLVKNAADTTTAFQVQNAAGTNIFSVDSTNQRVGIGTTAPSRPLEVLSSSVPQLRLTQATGIYSELQADAAGNLNITNVGSSTYADDFTTSTLDPGWTFVDPVGNSSYSLTANSGHLRLSLPSGSTHDCYQTNMTCTRMMRSVSTNDAVYEIKIDGTNLSTDDHTYGLMLHKDDDNYFRFEFHRGSGSTTVTAYKEIANTFSAVISGASVTLGANNLLRITKTGDTYQLEYSLNGGSSWNYATGSQSTSQFNQSLAFTTAGPEVGNANANPATTGDFDYFHINYTENGYLNAGKAIFKNTNNTVTAFQVQNSSGVSLFNVDTTNSRIGIGTSAPTADLSFGVANRTINILAQTTSNTAGSNLTVNSGAGNGTGAGGVLTMQAGTGGATGAGGAVTVQGGTGGATSGTGGAAKLQGGTAIGAFAGGLATLQGGTAAATAGSVGGGVAITAAGGSATGTGAAGGNVTITAGSAGGTGANAAGIITLQAGAAAANNINGGDIRIYGGALFGGTGANGNVILAHNGTSTIGNVGIGTASPTSKLDVKGATADSTANALNVQNSAATNYLTVRNDGNVSIGQTPSNQISFGYTTVGATTDVDNAGWLNATSFTMGGTAGTVSSMSAYVVNLDSAPNNQFQFAIYTNKTTGCALSMANCPDQLVQKSAAGTLTSAGWNSINITASLSASATYWLVYNTNGSSTTVNNLKRDAGATDQNVFLANPFASDYPSPAFGNPTGKTNQRFSMYATIALSTSTNTAALTVSSAGNVGIGATTPQYRLQVQNATTSVLAVDTTTNRVGINLAASDVSSADLSFGSGNRTINVVTQTTTNTAGGTLTVNSGAGNGTGAGGLLTIQSGTGGATGAGGAVTVQGGTGGATSGTGGAAKLQGGTAVGAFAGGLATVQGGTAAATAGSNGGGVAITGAAGSSTGTGGTGGNVTITSGNAGGSAANAGGNISLTAGTATSTGAAGTIVLTGGSAGGAAAGGSVSLVGGAAAATAGSNGGAVVLTGAAGTSTGAGGAGGNVTITAGNAGGSGGNNGGNITLQAGSATGAGTVGGVLVKNAANSTTAFQVQNTAGTSTFLDVDTTNGRVGIGTAAPAYILDVTAAAPSTLIANFKNTTNDASSFIILDTTGTLGSAGFTFKSNGTSVADFYASPDQKVHYYSYADGSDALTVDLANHRVGINQSNPTATLHLLGPTLTGTGTSADGVLVATGSNARNGSGATPGGNVGASSITAGSGGNGTGSNSSGGTAGTFTINTGTGGASTGTGTAQAGGVLALNTGTGGAAVGTSGAGLTAANGGGLTVTTGNGGAQTGGSGATVGGNAGAIALTSGNGGAVSIAAGTAGTGGAITLQAGAGGAGTSTSLGGNGGIVTFKGGNAGASTNGNGGNILLQGGTKTGTGTEGSVIVQAQNDNTTVFQVQNSAGATAISVDTTNTNIAANGGAEAGAGPPTSWSANGTSTISKDISVFVSGTASAGVNAGTTANNGVKNTLASSPSISSRYIVSFSAKLISGTAFTTLDVRYSPDNGTSTVACTNYNSQTLVTTGWTKITCTIDTTATAVTTALLIIRQSDTPGVGRVFNVDNLAFIKQDTGTNAVSTLRVGGIASQNLTLFTLDSFADRPFTGTTNTSILGSMYYDTTLGRIQCYEADGWGRCGTQNRVITLTPEYQGAVLTGDGTLNTGTMTSDFCINRTTAPALSINVSGSNCAVDESRSYYAWTAQATNDYDVWVRYQLPSDFSSFDTTPIQFTGWRSSSSTGTSVTMTVYSAAGVVCGTATSIANTTTWTTTTYTSSGCTPSANQTLIFRISLSVGVNNEIARIGDITLNYVSK